MLTLGIFVLMPCLTQAQMALSPANPGKGEIPLAKVSRASGNIILDGNIEEPDWFRGTPAGNFWQWFPTDSMLAELQTEIYFTYDDENFYIAAKCYSISDKYVVPSLRRDFRAGGSDNLTFVFDTFNDKTNAFFFGTNPEGVLREGLIANGGSGRENFSESWDNKWQGEVKKHDGYWSAELAIPFKTLRYQEGSTKWRFNCYRFETQKNERSSWYHIPRNQFITDLAFMGDLTWDEPLKKSGTNLVLIPYVSADAIWDFEATDDVYNFNRNFGGDAKIAITSGMNLDLTGNPDFSQVEVDRQVTNLQRFEVFFPERRQFFLENADLFGTFGDNRINPFFSRRIGVATDTTEDLTIQNPIYYGVRLSGKLNEDWRAGLLNMQTAKDENNDLPSFNYTVAAVQRKVFSRSNVGFIFVNKQAFGDQDSETYNPYNRVMGVDYNLATPDNAWMGKTFYHRSFTPEAADTLGQNFAHGLTLGYRERRFAVRWEHQWVGEGYNAEVGYVPRKDFFQMLPRFQLFFYPKHGKIVQHGPILQSQFLFTPGHGRSDQEVRLRWEFSFRDNSRLEFEARNEYTYLFEEFDPSRQDVHFLPGETDYTYSSFNVEYNSDGSKPLSFRLEPSMGQFFNGNRLGLRSSVSYRMQPFGTVTLDYNYNRINLAGPFVPVNLHLIGPRIDLTFTKKLFLTAFIQYNNQIDNLNVNARFQWRFKPVSDFFLVYTDNYFPNDFKVKNRAIVAKLTYWLNI